MAKYILPKYVLGKSFNKVISEKNIFVHLLVNDNQLYNDARWIQREIPVIYLYNINRLVFIMQKHSVLCETETTCLNIVYINSCP
jgi:hypothetical protein